MSYTLSALQTQADCDLVLNIATRDRKDLEYKQITLERQKETYGENSVEVEAEIAGVQAELSAVTQAITALPDGDTKENLLDRQESLQHKLYLLNDRKENYGATALVNKEYSLAKVMAELKAADDFISQVTAYKATI